MAGRKSQSHVDDVKLFLAREFHGFGCVGDDGIGSGHKAKNAFLKIESKQRGLSWIKFHSASIPPFSKTLKSYQGCRGVRHAAGSGSARSRDCAIRAAATSRYLHSFRLRAILPALRDGGTSMRSSIRAVSLFPVVFAAVLACVIAVPAFASGEDKPAAPSATASPAVARPDREKKVYTNDDIDLMWPKEQQAANDSQTSSASAFMPAVARRSTVVSRAASTTRARASRQNKPVWYATQIESLYAQLHKLSNR